MSEPSQAARSAPSHTIAAPLLAQKLLNPGAIEFPQPGCCSSGSTTSEQASSAPSEDLNESQSDTIAHSTDPSTKPTAANLGANHPESHMAHTVHGWESPQGVLPPSPIIPDGVTRPGLPNEDFSDARGRLPPSAGHHYGGGWDSREASPPPMMHHHHHPVPYAWGPPPYPHYVAMYAHDPHLDRAGSPPPAYPTGASPPLGPGFLSVALPRSHSFEGMGGSPPLYLPPGSSPVYASSPHSHALAMHPLSGSPPGGGHVIHYVPHPHHAAYAAGPAREEDIDMSQRMTGLALGGGSPRGHATIAGPGAGGEGNGLVRPGPSETRASARIARSNRAGGAYNPTDFRFNVEEAEAEGGRTTVMVRNIPNKYTQSMMLSILEKSGFKGTFDFFYLPIDFRNRCNLGYAFINFINAADMVRLYTNFHAKHWDEYNSKKVCEISYGRVQGCEALVEHFRASKFPSEEAEYQPLVYRVVDGKDGKRQGAHAVSIHEWLGTSAMVDLAVGSGGGGSAQGDGGSCQGEEE